jgi:hypothetical protein
MIDKSDDVLQQSMMLCSIIKVPSTAKNGRIQNVTATVCYTGSI